VSLALVAGLLAARAGYPLVDPLLALGVAAVIAWAGVRIVRRVSDVLADAAVLDSAEIERRARAVPGVAGVHKVRSRGTADAVALDLHVQVDPALGIGRAHAIGHQVLAELCAAFPQVTDVVVHVEPEWALVDGELARSVRQVVAQFPVEAHEITVHEQDGVGIELDLHLEMDPTFSLADAHQLATRIESAVQARVPALDRIVTHLEPRTGTLEPGALPAVGRDYPALVRAAADQVDGLSNLHDVRVVRVAGGVRLSAHVNAAGSLSLAEAHALVEALEARVRSAAPELERVTIHVEPGEP
jgi:divalent metal cation (Fe/Co/Zn/Cd) transporter